MTAPIAPFWLNPLSPGQLSNKRGGNPGADAIALQLKYANPRASGDFIGGLRIVATKPSTGLNTPISTVLDTWWMGAGNGNNLPNGGKVRPNNSFFYNGRVYINLIAASGPAIQMWSSPVNGPNAGAWRQEVAPGALTGQLNGGYTVYSMVGGTNGFAYAATSGGFANLFVTAINADGTFAGWQVMAIPSNDLGYFTDRQLFTYADNAGNAYLILWAGMLSTGTRASRINSDGTITAWTTGGVNTQRGYNGVYFAPDTTNSGAGTLWFIAGSDGVNCLLTIASAPVAITAGQITIGAWATAGTGIPAVRGCFGFAVVNGIIYVVGGGSTGAPGEATPTTTIYRLPVGSLGTTVWTTDAFALGTANASMGCVATSVSGISTVGGAGTGGPSLILIGGTVNPTIVQTAGVTASTGALAAAPAGITQGVELTGANLGTGGVVTNNPDGTVTVTYTWQAGPIGGLALLDGDVVTVAAYVVDSQGGDLGPSSVTVFKIGQPPVISGITVTPANDGRPVVTFNYSAGAGGDIEFSYRVQVAPNGFDSATRYDSANNVILVTAPYLVTGILQTVTITVTSRDLPMAGSTNQTVNSATTYTPTLTGPGQPIMAGYGLNNAAGFITLNWANVAPAGTTPGNRIYYRRSGTSTWTLLAELAGVVTSYVAMDQIALGVNYDFNVSQVDINNHSESAMSSVFNTNVKIDPVAGGYSGFLHIQGQGATHFAPLLVQLTPDVTAVFDTTATLPFQQLTPSVTLGVAHYVKLKVTQLVPTLANQKQIMDVIATAYAGGVMIYRDGFGGMITCQIDADQTERYLPPVARESTLNLVQIPNQFQPSTAQGSALGLLQQVFNSIVPLDPSEAFL